MSTSTRTYLSTILVPLAVILAVVGICGLLYQREANEIEKNLLDREIRRSEIFSRFLQGDLQAVIKDLRQLADGDGLQAFLLSGKPADLDRAIHRFGFFSRENPDYDQVRYLDENGQEIIRVNWNGAVVPPDKLQYKGDRPYFLKAHALARDQFFISAFDLNVENGRIEEPLKPMLRLATPVFDATGRRRGVVIINELGANLIARLQQFTPQYQDRLRVLNAQGYWMKAGQADQEWGFMFPDRAGLTLARTDPALWARISHENEGQTPLGGGYFTWCRVVPRAIVAGQPNSVVADDDFLVIASELSPAEWAAYFTDLRETFLIVALVLLLLLILSGSFFHTRQRARQERDRFFTLTRDMLCIAGFDGYFKKVNPAWTSTLGYAAEEMLAKPFVEFIHPDDVEKTQAVYESQLVAGRELISFENRYRCKDGTYRWLSWNSRPLMDEQVIFASARDLTDRKQIEEQILRLNQDLKQRAGELEASNQELEAFSYSVSHDLRAPLRHIHGFVELLQKSATLQAEPSSRHQMSVIARAAREMGRLIDDLLAFSRTGRAKIHPTKIDLREMIDHVIEELRIEGDVRKVIWEIKPLPMVFADPTLLRLVWTNLLSNALKYTRPCPVAKIEIGHLDGGANKPGEPEVVFYVRDNGVGFDMQYASKLFGVFQRLHRAEDFEGTGIGLANVHRIILRHGGRVWAESKPGSGATFYFTLPLIQPVHSHA